MAKRTHTGVAHQHMRWDLDPQCNYNFTNPKVQFMAIYRKFLQSAAKRGIIGV